MTNLVFDDVRVYTVVRTGELEFDAHARNIGHGLSELSVLQVTVTASALASIGESPESWVARTVQRRARTHPNDGGKMHALKGEELIFDSRDVVDDLGPTHTARGCDPESQAEDLHELRRLHREGPPGLHAMGTLMFARDDLTRGLARRDMARATERSELQVAEIIEEHRTAHIRCMANGAAARHAA